MKLAIELVKANNFAAAAIQNIEKDYYANSSRSAKEAKRKAVKDLLAAAHMASYPLDPKKIKLIAGVLREGGYKSADTLWRRRRPTLKRAGLGRPCLTDTSSYAEKQLNEAKDHRRKPQRSRETFGHRLDYSM